MLMFQMLKLKIQDKFLILLAFFAQSNQNYIGKSQSCSDELLHVLNYKITKIQEHWKFILHCLTKLNAYFLLQIILYNIKKKMGCSMSNIQIQELEKQIESPIGKLDVEILKFELFKNFRVRFQKINSIRLSVSNQTIMLYENQMLDLQKCHKGNPKCFSYVINSLKKRYGRLLMIQLIVQKNKQLFQITEIIDINPVIKSPKSQKSQIKSYFYFEKQCIGTIDLSLTFYEQPSSNISLQIIPQFIKQTQNLKGQIKFNLIAGQEILQKIIKLNENNHKKVKSNIQIPHFLNNIVLKAQFIDQNQNTHYSQYLISTNMQILNNTQIQSVVELNFRNIPSFGKLIIKQTLADKNTQNTTNSSKQMFQTKNKDLNRIEGTTNPSLNKIQTKKQITSIQNIQEKSKSKKIVLPPICKEKKVEDSQNKYFSQNNINLYNQNEQIKQQEEDLRNYQISLKYIPAL